MKPTLEALKIFTVYRLLTLSSFSGVILFFLLVKQDIDVLPFVDVPDLLSHYWIRGVGLVLCFVLLSGVSLKFAISFIKSSETLESAEIKPIENIAMPTYIGLFVIALEIGDNKIEESIAVLAVLLVLWGFFERVFYFNPVWLLFGYRFYEVKTVNHNSFTLITKRQDIKESVKLTNVKRINEYTFLEINNGIRTNNR